MISERLGHTSVAFILGVYAHVLPGLQKEAVSRLAVIIDGYDYSGYERITMQEPKKPAILIPGKKAVEMVQTPEGARELYEKVCAALGVKPKPPKDET